MLSGTQLEWTQELASVINAKSCLSKDMFQILNILLKKRSFKKENLISL